MRRASRRIGRRASRGSQEDAGRPGGKWGSGLGAERHAGPGSRMRPQLQRGCLRFQMSPFPKAPPTQQRRPQVRGGSYRRLRPSSRPPWPPQAGKVVQATATPAQAGGRLRGLQRPAPVRLRPVRLARSTCFLQWESCAGGGGARGGAGRGTGWGLNLCFPSGLL